jgi:hypothetical protein
MPTNSKSLKRKNMVPPKMGSVAESDWHVASIMPPVEDVIGKYKYQGWRPCMEWCATTFDGGIGATAWGSGWRYVGEGVFEFKRAEDRLLFLLRWT